MRTAVRVSTSRPFCFGSPSRARPAIGLRARARLSGSGALDARPLKKSLQLPRPRGMAQLAQRLGLDLADALAGHGEVLAHLFQRVLAAVAEAEAHLDHLLLARSQRLQQGLGLLLQRSEEHT